MAALWCVLFPFLATSLLVPVFDFNVSALLAPGTDHYLVLYTDERRSDLDELTETFKSPTENPKTQKLKYVLLDCGKNNTVCEAHNVTQVPEVKYYYDGRAHDYEWEWTAEGFYEIGHKLSNPAIYSLQRRVVFDNFKEKYDFSFMSWFFPLIPDADHITKGELLGTIAKDYHHRPFYFAMAAENSLRESEGIRFGEMPIVKQYGADEVFGFNITLFDENSLRNFVEEHKWGLMPALNRSLWKAIHKDCQARGKVLFLVFHKGSNYTHYGDYLNNLRLLNWDFRRFRDFRFQFASVDIEKYPELANTYNVSTAPTMLVVDWRRNETEVKVADFDPTSKLHTIRYLREIYDFHTPRPILSFAVSPEPASEEDSTNWRQFLVVSGMLFLWCGVRSAANRKIKTG